MRGSLLGRGSAAVLALGVAVTVVGPVAADPIIRNLGGGWQATILNPEVSDLVGVGYDSEDRVLSVRKTAVFDAIDEFTELPVPISIIFTQIAADPNSATRIAIVDENITNNTGVAWPSFRNTLIDGGQVAFNQPLSAGFSIAPYTTRSYNGASTEVTFAGGVVPNGGVWTPGLPDGELVIDVSLANSNPVTFSLKELPTPEPGTLSALLLSAAVMLRRRAI